MPVEAALHDLLPGFLRADDIPGGVLLCLAAAQGHRAGLEIDQPVLAGLTELPGDNDGYKRLIRVRFLAPGEFRRRQSGAQLITEPV